MIVPEHERRAHSLGLNRVGAHRCTAVGTRPQRTTGIRESENVVTPFNAFDIVHEYHEVTKMEGSHSARTF